MNFLAHLFLSCKDEDLLIGNFLTDFLKKKEADALAPKFQPGVSLHRQIDLYTDAHPIVLQGVRRLYPFHSKYASVIIDVFYDYFLIHNWSQFSDESFLEFRSRVYGILKHHLPDMPARIQSPVRHMVDGDWLMSYGNKDGLEYTFSRMSRRVSKPELLTNVLESLMQFQVEMNEEFLAFFPDVIQEVDCFC